jgi:hypothetical protein
MTPTVKKSAAVLLLALLALPTGLCSLYFTPVGISSLFSKDAFTQSIRAFALVCSTAGWMICGLTIWGASRLTRAATPRKSGNGFALVNQRRGPSHASLASA